MHTNYLMGGFKETILAATLAATMCMGLVACGSSGNDAQTTKRRRNNNGRSKWGK